MILGDRRPGPLMVPEDSLSAPGGKESYFSKQNLSPNSIFSFVSGTAAPRDIVLTCPVKNSNGQEEDSHTAAEEGGSEIKAAVKQFQ